MTRDQRPRRTRRTIVALVVAVAIHGAPVAAIDLLRSYELSRVNDGQLKVARARADQGREALPQATAQLWPNIGLNYAYGYTDQQRTFAGISDSQRYPSRNGAIQLRQPIYRKNLVAQVDQARSSVQGTEAQLDKDFQSLGVRVVGAYFDALFARDNLDLILVQRATYEAQLRAAKLGLNAGTGTRTDIDDIQSRYDLLVADEIKVRLGIASSTQQLEIFVGEKIQNLSTLNAPALRLDEYDPGKLDTWLERALMENPDMRVLRSKLDAAIASVEIAKSGHYPTLDLVAQYTESTGDSTNTLPRTDNNVGYIGMQLTVPIFAGGYVNSQVRQATAALDEAREAYDYAKDDLQLQIKKEYDTLNASIARVKALEIALVSGDQMVISTQKSVQGGVRTVLDVLIAEQQRFNTRVELARARYQILISSATLHGYVGDLNQEKVARINQVLVKAS